MRSTRRRVRFFKVFQTISQSWFAFVLAMTLLGAFWYLCYWLIATYAPGYLHFFKWGVIMALIIALPMLIFNEPLVVLIMGCKRLKKRSDCPKLWEAVEKATPLLARPKPRLYICPVTAKNAFAFGWGIPFFSAVAATQGLIDSLSDEELSAVMAHEIGHIINKDILVSMAMAISVMVIAYTGWLLLRLGPYSSGRRKSSSSKGKGGAVLIIVIIIGLLLYLFGRILGVILQMFVSRQREYAADAQSARIIGSSQPLISALQEIIKNPELSNRSVNAAIGFLCTADPDPSDFMSTHPSITKRLKALENLEA